MRLLVLLAALSAVPAPVIGAADCSEDAIIVFDGSGSMGETGFEMDTPARIVEARQAMARALPPIARLRRLGLVIYGPSPRACRGVDLRFGPVTDAAGRILEEIGRLQPSGETPLTEAVAVAAEALDYRHRSGTVVLVTDGRETCGGATCRLARHLAAEGLDLTIHVVGFRVQGGADLGVAACLAEATGGLTIAPGNVEELVAAMAATLGCPVYGAAAPGRGGR